MEIFLSPICVLSYENPELELRHVDLSWRARLRPRAMAEKASAGFSLYGVGRRIPLRRVSRRTRITAGIRTL